MGRKSEQSGESGNAFSHPDPIVDEALNWLILRQDGAFDDADQRRFEVWLAQSPRHAQEFRNLETMWESPALGKAAASIRRPAPAARRPKSRVRLHALAAAAVLMIAVGAWQAPGVLLRWQADYLTATGARAEISLPDGSTMLLNTASAATVDFRDGRRNVTLLQGEAFFDVRRDPSRPFRVSGRFGEVQVKGTAFAVRADETEDLIVLERGQVEVSRISNRADQVDLRPGEMVTATATSLSAVAMRDPEQLLAWRDGRIIFENQPMSRVLSELRRYYGGAVVVLDNRVGDLVITGNYRLDDVPGAIRTLADATGVTMNSLPGGLIILR